MWISMSSEDQERDIFQPGVSIAHISNIFCPKFWKHIVQHQERRRPFEEVTYDGYGSSRLDGIYRPACIA